MAEQVFDGIHLDLTPTKRLQFDYREGDLEVVYRRTSPHAWQDMIAWLERQGERDNELTPGEVVALVEDLRTLNEKRVPFIGQPARAFEEAHRYRGENIEKHAELHRRIETTVQQMRH